MKRVVSCASALIVLAAVTDAAASPAYPGVIEETLGLPAPPPCTICHASDAGGTGTVIKPFGRAMLGFGLQANDVGSLRAALAASESRKQDSDGDGVSDVDELRAGTDPNDGPGAVGASSAIVPEYGCDVAQGRPKGRFGLAALGLAMAVVARRRSRRRR